MIPVIKPEIDDPEWIAWHDRASKAMSALLRAYEQGAEIAISDKPYQDAKQFLLRLTHEKCAYCESVITNTHPGEVEHYRPKGRIRDEAGQVVKMNVGGKAVEHPGYWWLAYDWRNLLPSCIDCNRARYHGDSKDADTIAGKADYFPIRGKRAEKPTDPLPDEQALLLDPSETSFDPNEHFDFLEDGTIKPKTDRARYTCMLLGLNIREQLVAGRVDAVLNAKATIMGFIVSAATAASAALPPETKRQLLSASRQQVNSIWNGEKAYSAFARRALQDWQKSLAQYGGGAPIQLPLPPLS